VELTLYFFEGFPFALLAKTDGKQITTCSRPWSADRAKGKFSKMKRVLEISAINPASFIKREGAVRAYDYGTHLYINWKLIKFLALHSELWRNFGS